MKWMYFIMQRKLGSQNPAMRAINTLTGQKAQPHIRRKYKVGCLYMHVKGRKSYNLTKQTFRDHCYMPINRKVNRVLKQKRLMEPGDSLSPSLPSPGDTHMSQHPMECICTCLLKVKETAHVLPEEYLPLNVIAYLVSLW